MKSRKQLGIFLSLAAVVSVFAGCKKKKGGNDDSSDSTPSTDVTDQALIDAIDASNPEVEVVVGEYDDHLTPKAVDSVNAVSKTFGSSSILDMPRSNTISIVYNASSNSSEKFSPTLFQNIINANKQLHTITVKDRAGKYLERDNDLLSTDGTKITIEKDGGFDYGEVYQISINNADYLSFENKDPSIRTLTIEIEDSASEKDKTYDTKTLKSITNIDLTKVSSKKVKDEGGLYSFEYNGSFPNLAKGAVFYVTEAGHPSAKLDFYGIFQSKKNKSDGKVIVFYETPKASDIYEAFHLKNVVNMDLSGAEVLITDDVAKKEFKRSSLALGIAKATVPYVKADTNKITNVFSEFKIKVNVYIVDNSLSMKFDASILNYKLDTNLYLTVDFAYEKVSVYSIDFDISTETAFVLPVGVDYKIKFIEETDEICNFNAALSLSSFPSDPADLDFQNAIINEIQALESSRNQSALYAFEKNSDLAPATSGSKFSMPVVALNLTFLSPLIVRYKADFYIDAGFQALLAFSQRTQSKKVDFCFANVGGADTDVENTINKSSNFSISYAGDFRFEIGFKNSFGFSILGFYDYLHAESYAEYSTRANVSGLLVADITINTQSTDFTGFVSANVSVNCLAKVGLDYKVLIFSYNISKTLYDFTLLRVKLNNSLDGWADSSVDLISLNKQTLSLDETKVLSFNTFNAFTRNFDVADFDADEKFSVLSGALWSDSLLESSERNMFTYEVLTHQTDVTVSEAGVIHVKDGSEPEFDFSLKVNVSGWCGDVESKTITCHYEANDKHEVYLKWDDNYTELLGDYGVDSKITLPKAPSVEGYKFASYSVGLDTYDVGDEITMIDDTLIINVSYTPTEQHLVRFYDGDCNLVYEDLVYDGKAATEPNAIMRDRYTDSSQYKFVGWNCKFDKVKSALDVYGIYIGIEEE